MLAPKMHLKSLLFACTLVGCTTAPVNQSDAPSPVDTDEPAVTSQDPGPFAEAPADFGAPPDFPPQVRPARTVTDCFPDFTGPTLPGPDYDQFEPTIPEHCVGTDHQDIEGVERVVFLGDSVTVGTPPTRDKDSYRNRLAGRLKSEFGLEGPNDLWRTVDVTNGTTIVRESGDFASCAKWGARIDDLQQDRNQIGACLPEKHWDKRTLVVMTVGGNDLANLTKGFQEGKSTEALWDQAREAIRLLREAVTWIKEPGRFTNGVYVVFANFYEFTDGTGDTAACPAAAASGFGDPVTDPAYFEIIYWMLEEYMSIAVDTESDMMFMMESFCGHGYRRDDPDGRCYLGPGAEIWFDVSCTHPNPTGHREIAERMERVILE